VGWALTGPALVLALLLQAAEAAGADSLLSGGTFGAVGALLGGTAYGATWWLRAGLWLAIGALLIFGDARRWAQPAALGLGLAMPLAHALVSHSAAAPDPAGALAAHWLHLTAMSLWIGGLLAFVIVLPALRGTAEAAPLAGRLVAYFSNYARAGVALLAISGAFLAWLHIGTPDALFSTAYGRALLGKTALLIPVLALAAVNLIWTGRRLAAGEAVWVGRLRALVSVEAALALGVLLGGALMTAGPPARTVQAARDAQPVGGEQPSYFGMNVVDDQMIHLEIVPGFVGENTFIVNPYDADGEVITDASLIRLRFTHLEQNLGQSELRIEPDGPDDDGFYEATGSNLSATGRWRVRMTVARPGQFDLVSDFEVDARLPDPPPARVIDASIPLRQRQLNMAAAGLALVGVALIFAAPKRRMSGENLLALAGLAVGLVCLANAGALALDERRPAGALSVRDAFAYPALLGSTGGVFLALENSTAQGDRLVGATTEVARAVELHRTMMDGDVASMESQLSYELPAGGRLEFAPGGDHLMLIDLHRDLTTGERFAITLQFASGRQVVAEVTVR
jgi:copper(I)-binding protein/putative copper export protein